MGKEKQERDSVKPKRRSIMNDLSEAEIESINRWVTAQQERREIENEDDM